MERGHAAVFKRKILRIYRRKRNAEARQIFCGCPGRMGIYFNGSRLLYDSGHRAVVDAAADASPVTYADRRTYARCNGQAYPKKTATPIRTASPAPKASSGIGTIHIVAYVILGVIICAEFSVICYLVKKKK